MTVVAEIGHTLPLFIGDFQLAMIAAIFVVVIELGVISWVRHRYMDTPALSAMLDVDWGGRPGVRHRRPDRQILER